MTASSPPISTTSNAVNRSGDPVRSAGVERVAARLIAQAESQRRQRREIAVWIAAGWLVVIIAAAAFADLLPLRPYASIERGLAVRTPPGLRWPEFLGTDSFGRSMLSRIVYGARQSLLIGLGAATIAATLGTMVGVTAGYLRGKVDAVINLLLDSLLAFPGLILLMAIASIGRRDVLTIVIALSLLGIPGFARVTRARTLALADREFVIAARSMGATTPRIMLREIVPALLPLIVAVLFLVLAGFIVAEGALSFLGLGVPPPRPSWGGMIDDGRPALRTSPHLIFVPSACLVLTVYSFRVVGERITNRIATVDKRGHR